MDDRRAYDPFAPVAEASLTGAVSPMTDQATATTTAGDTAKADTTKADTTKADGDDFDSMKKPELIKFAKELGVSSDGTKDDIIARLRAI